MLTSMKSIIDKALTLPRQTVAVACAQDAEALTAVAEAHAMGLADFILVGNTDKIKAIAERIELDLTAFELLDARGEACGAAATVQVVASGRAQILLKGFVDSSVLFKAVLDRDAGLRNGSTVSHTVVMDVPGFDKLYLLTDAAMIIKPDLATKRQIVLNAVKVARALGNPDPVVGVLCESEKVNPKMPATMDAAALVEMNAKGELPGCRVGRALRPGQRHQRAGRPAQGHERPPGGQGRHPAGPGPGGRQHLLQEPHVLRPRPLGRGGHGHQGPGAAQLAGRLPTRPRSTPWPSEFSWRQKEPRT